MRSYGEFCALARALDVVGDRWTLLILRELAARPCRFRDLSEGLPGIAANLLAERLRLLQAEGVITHDRAATYRLTDRGKALGPALKALVRWGCRSWPAAAARTSTGPTGWPSPSARSSKMPRSSRRPGSRCSRMTAKSRSSRTAMASRHARAGPFHAMPRSRAR